VEGWLVQSLGPRQVSLQVADTCEGMAPTSQRTRQGPLDRCFRLRPDGAGAWRPRGEARPFRPSRAQGVFAGGDPCGGAPPRSMRVKFECSLEERSWGASEPATCAYAAHMATPAACKRKDLAALEARLAEVRRIGEEAAREMGVPLPPVPSPGGAGGEEAPAAQREEL
jgi:hypothetical protein